MILFKFQIKLKKNYWGADFKLFGCLNGDVCGDFMKILCKEL